MDIKKLIEELKSLPMKEAKQNGRSDIDFDSIGSGFYLEMGTTSEIGDKKESYYTFYCNGFFNNNDKELEYKSDIVAEYPNTQETDKKLNELKAQLEKDLKEAADEFDKKVFEIFKRHNLEKYIAE